VWHIFLDFDNFISIFNFDRDFFHFPLSPVY
jgi:hypothetical protein